MKTALLSLALISTLALAGGCGKTEVATPPAATDQSTKAATPAPPQPAASAIPATNPVAPAAAPVKTEIPAAPASSDTDKLTSLIGQKTGGLAALSQDQVVQGLKEALGNGLQKAVAGLGRNDGFLTNVNVKIPLPEKLQKVETILRAMKQDKLVDDFIVTMNRAAEQAVPAAASVFVDSLQQMKVEDAKAILAGTNDAATQYFSRTTRTNLYARFYPLVQKSTASTGATAAYKQVVDKATGSQSLGGLTSALSGSAFDKNSLDVDAYVTNKALDDLFKMVADEEKQIRQNPVARTTDMLQKVFGSLKN